MRRSLRAKSAAIAMTRGLAGAGFPLPHFHHNWTQNESVAYLYGSVRIGKKNMKNIQLSLLMLSFLSVMIACQPTLKEFQPKNDSLFKITFSYPASWVWEEDIPFDDFIGDPPPSERIVLKNAAISIQVYKPANPQAQMQEWMDLEGITTLLRSDTTIQIDGYNARWLTIVYPPLTTNGANVQEVIYLLTEDRFYTIDLYIPESEIDGRLHKEFKELIKTIKILP
jgi:hypothetical protein